MQQLTAIKAKALIQDLSGLRTIREEWFRQALEIALPILEQQERGDGDWIEWGGGASGSCPVAYATLVEVKSRNGHVAEDCAEAFEWCHEADGDDIIAYRIIPEQPTNQNGEQ